MNPLIQHLSKLPSDLVLALQVEFQKLHEQYFLGRWEPSQLDGGRFAEHIFRVIEYKQKGTFTPVGTTIPRVTIYTSASQDTNLQESVRFHILKMADLILDFRNKRNVAHPGLVNVNEMDSTFVIQSANWIIAELIRLETQMSPADAQAEIKKIIERKVPIIEEIGGRLKILNPSIDIREKVLVICYQKFPEKISEDTLLDWTEYDVKHKSRFRSYLNELNSDKRIDYKNGEIVLTRRGMLWIEKYLSFEIEV